MPRRVRDYVIIHEMAHLIHPNHSKKFWELVNRYTNTLRGLGAISWHQIRK
ncbi:MAG: M48 family metallopeptidase [Candidatus Thermoplasmatota archaeon]|nr:M48 family metallopeptidase [Candidatus Thermoplasmatota archaeon]